MKNLLILVLAFLSGSVLAFGDQAQGQLQGQAQGQGQIAINSSRIDVDTRANAAAWQAQQVVVNPSTTVEAPTPTPNNVTVNNNAPAPEKTVNVRSVPNVFAGNVYPTAPCMGSSTLGAAALGWGATVGTSWADDECGIRETARSFQNLNLTTDAVAVLCSSKYAAIAPVCKALAPKPTPQ